MRLDPFNCILRLVFLSLFWLSSFTAFTPAGIMISRSSITMLIKRTLPCNMPHVRHTSTIPCSTATDTATATASTESTESTSSTSDTTNTTKKWGRNRPRRPTTPDRRWEVKPIGRIESPYEEKFGVPKQATILWNGATLAEGNIVLFPGYEDCITSLDGFDYIWAITYLHLNSGFKTKIKPQPVPNAVSQPPTEVGLFASRAPHRPNPIGMSALQVVSVDVSAGIIRVRGLDLLNDTPVLDIKPYIPAFDSFPTAAAGWLDAIHIDSNAGRDQGYQNIVSKRGARAARSFRKHELIAQQQKEPEQHLQIQECANVVVDTRND